MFAPPGALPVHVRDGGKLQRNLRKRLKYPFSVFLGRYQLQHRLLFEPSNMLSEWVFNPHSSGNMWSE